jgi:asparagine synthase (glutamine-hydrolysing)
MCGIVGIFGMSSHDSGTIASMTQSLHHRGPDDVGFWIDKEVGLALGHRRLAILDLSPQGHQPIISEDGRWILAYNGEIYNHLALRQRLEFEGRMPVGGWRGRSDSETLVEAIAAWGVDDALRECVGMFALAAWDRKGQQLLLARDRFGEKPLYYGRVGRDFAFASELKALRCHPEFEGSIDRSALAEFAALAFVPAPLSIYRGISKLMPGSILAVESCDSEPRLRHFWSYRDVVMEGLSNPFREENDAIDALDSALRAAVAGQAMADVPVGAFLSGGVDSSTIVSLYQAVSGRPVRTYSIGFAESRYDESADAKLVAGHLGTIHHEHFVGVDEARSVIPLLPTIYDEPFADSSQIPTYIVSKFARSEVKVAISGDGGDELFAGYNRHRIAPSMWKRLAIFPSPIRKILGRSAAFLPDSAWRALTRVAGETRPELGAKAGRIAAIMGEVSNIDEVYDSFLDEWYGLGSPVRGAMSKKPARTSPSDWPDQVRVAYADSTRYLPDDILVKVDRAAMAVGLETRVPFLDHRVAAMAARIDPALKIHGGRGKQILRRLLDKYVPRHLVDRPKAGFAVPIGEWIKGPLRPWAEELLDSSSLDREGWFDARMIQQRWAMHLSGQRDSTAALWPILMFQAWLREERA